MSSTIGSFSQMMHRPDPSQMASKLFAKLDSKNRGYLEQSDLQSALKDITGNTDSNADALFAKLDSNTDGKVTQDEMATTLSKLSEQLDSQFNQMRMQHGMAGSSGMPPPPPQDDQGFSRDELTTQLEEAGSSDSPRSSLINRIVNNFEAADADGDGDGKVSFREAMAYDRKSATTDTTAAAGAAATASTTAGSDTAGTDARLLRQILDLMHAYGGHQATSQSAATTTTVSTSA